jgi:hypothetical protein
MTTQTRPNSVEMGFIRLADPRPQLSTPVGWVIEQDGPHYKVKLLAERYTGINWLFVSNLREDCSDTYNTADAYFCPYEGNFWYFNSQWHLLGAPLDVRRGVQQELQRMGYRCEGEVSPVR